MITLSPEEHDRAKKQILDLKTKGLTPVEKPKAIILAGQPGAGKSGLAQESINHPEFKGNHVRIDIDELRSFHGQYGELQKSDPKNAASLVQKDASQWGKELRAHCIENNLNVVVDGTLGNPKNADKLINQLKEKGYQIEVHVMALDKDRSDQGIYKRYEGGLERGAPRWVEPDTIAQDAYKGMVDSLQTIENKHGGIPIKYYGIAIDDNGQRKTVELNKPEQVKGKELVETERNRDWSQNEKSAYVKISDEVVKKMNTRGADKQELEQAEKTLKGERYQTIKKEKTSEQSKSPEEQIKAENKKAKILPARSGNYSGRITHITENEVVQQVKPNLYYRHKIDAKQHGLKVNDEVKIVNNKGKTTIRNTTLDKMKTKGQGLAKASPKKNLER